MGAPQRDTQLRLMAFRRLEGTVPCDILADLSRKWSKMWPHVGMKDLSKMVLLHRGRCARSRMLRMCIEAVEDLGCKAWSAE